MASPFTSKLQALPDSVFWRRVPADPQAAQELEKQLGFTLPADYRELLLFSDGVALNAPRTQINLEGIDGLQDNLTDDRFIDNLPGMLVIGDNGGGSVYFYDPQGKLGRGKFALFLVPLGDLFLKRAVFIAPSLTSAMEQALAGEGFTERFV